MKKYIIFAGVNGAGKSTLYSTTHYCNSMPRVNTDDIVKNIGSWKNTADLMTAGKIAIKKLNQYISEGITFNQETTLCGHSIFRSIEKAKQHGYTIEIHFVGVDSVEIAKQRIAQRVQAGGHGIPDADVERRYIESINNLKKVLPLCDLAAIYDNTETFRRFAILKNGEIVRISKNIPTWYKQIYSPY